MEEEKKHIDELIATYLTEGLDKNALAELKAWIAASPENEDYSATGSLVLCREP